MVIIIKGAKMRNECIQVRVSQGEKESVKMAARLSGMSVSAWVRLVLRKKAIEKIRGGENYGKMGK